MLTNLLLGQTENKNLEIYNKVSQGLELACSAQDVANLMVILGKHLPLYMPIDSIPSINPLNPLRSGPLSSPFGKRMHPIYGKVKRHYGLDIPADAGTPIHAAASGTIILVKDIGGYGVRVDISHAYGFTTRYAHMAIRIPEIGDKVRKGDIIGFVGSSGNSTAPHLHYEVRKYGKPIDPEGFLNLHVP